LTGTSGTVANYSNGQSSNSNFSWELYQPSATSIQFSVLSGATQYSASSAVFVTNAWRHIAGVRNGNTLTIYVNGVAGATTVSVTGVTVSEPAGSTLKLGSYGNGSGYITGYMSNLRIVKGTAVYTSTFTPSTTPLTAVSGTTLLICQGTSFVDNSVNNFAITPTGDVKVITAWSPFGFTPQLLACQATRLVDNSNNNFTITAIGNVFANKTFSPFGFAPQLLTCQSATGIVDNSDNLLTITSTATTRVNPYNPFGYTNNSASIYTPSIHSGSTFHDGSGDYVTMPSSPVFNFSGLDFTVECWVYVTATGNNAVAYLGTGGSATHWGLTVTASNQVTFDVNTGQNWAWTNSVTTAGTAIQLNTWTHIACVRNGSGVFNIYFNGVRQYNTASFVNPVGATGTLFIGTYYNNYNNDGGYFRGYISDFRITRSAVYTSNFFPPLSTISNQITTANQSVLLLNYTNAGITDQHGTNNLESLGNTGLSAEDPLLGNYYSNYFDGTGDYLSIATIGGGDLGTGDFTIEYWMNAPATGSFSGPVGTQEIAGSATAGMWRCLNRFNSANGIYFAYTTGSAFVDLTFTTTSYNDGKWHHVAYVRSGTNLNAYVDGVQVGSTQTVSQNLTSGKRLTIGYNPQDTAYYTGYTSNLRIIKGTALYTSTFTPTTNPLTAISGTSLLTCQTNTFKDSSTNNYAITRNGDVSVRTFNPFQRNTGRSISFPTSGSYLMIPDNQNIRFGTSDLTIECWFYLIGNSTDGANLFAYNTSGATFGMVVHTNLTSYANKITIWIDTYGTGPFITGTATLVSGQWNFFALTRASGVWKLWLNGAQDGSNYTNAATPDRNLNLRIGGDNYNANRILNGYIKDFRITKGYARYTSAFTNPILPAPGL
jgi:hypothetical protein